MNTCVQYNYAIQICTALLCRVLHGKLAIKWWMQGASKSSQGGNSVRGDLFEYYVESRKVSQSYDKLIDLIVYDRVKNVTRCIQIKPGGKLSEGGFGRRLYDTVPHYMNSKH